MKKIPTIFIDNRFPSHLILSLITLSLIFLSSCDMFSTREPEKPDSDKSSFIPPTSPGIVIANLINSIKEKNAGSYISCLSDTLQNGGGINFSFTPSADALAIYSSIFAAWNINSERNAFNALMSKTPELESPSLTLDNSSLSLFGDSAVYTANYKLHIVHTISTLPADFAGTLHFTLTPHKDGLWSICRWIDNKPANDYSGATWSILKAQLGN